MYNYFVVNKFIQHLGPDDEARPFSVPRVPDAQESMSAIWEGKQGPYNQ